MLRLAQNVEASPTVWQNGLKVNCGAASGGPGSGFVGGSIGRALGVDFDNRFQCDIAEVIIFDARLADPDVQLAPPTRKRGSAASRSAAPDNASTPPFLGFLRQSARGPRGLNAAFSRGRLQWCCASA
jgi:hypothetical protein